MITTDGCLALIDLADDVGVDAAGNGAHASTRQIAAVLPILPAGRAAPSSLVE